MKHFKSKLFILSLAFTAPAILAQTVIIPLGQQSAPGVSADLPQRGVSAAAVQQRHGDPVARHAAVGEPPISRWDYQEFSVYFESNTVVHSVLQHRPRAN